MFRPKWTAILVFLAIATLLVLIRDRPSFPDPDTFYHAKMALEIRDHGFIHAFPWLQENALRDRFVDAHWLYHVILIPFVTLFDPLDGMRVSAVLFALVAFYALYRFLRSVGSPYPEWLTLVGALSFDFLQRMSMPKAGSLSVALLLFATWAMLRARPRTVFLIAVAFVWLYHGWPALFIPFVCVAIGDAVARRLVPSIAPRSHSFKAVALALGLGLLVGNVVNPYFPDSIAFSVTDFFKIAVTGGANIPVGTEWSPLPWQIMFQHDFLAFCAFGLAVLLMIPAGASRLFDLTAEKTRTAFALLFLTSVFAVLTARSMRYMEYLIPFLLLTVGALLAIVEPFLRTEAKRVVAAMRARPRSFGILALLVSLAIGCLAATDVDFAFADDGFVSASQYQGSADWLRQNVPAGATIFNPVWDTSLVYFYLDDTHYFLVGLDPRFMYGASKERYQAWFDLQSGVDADVSKVRTVFQASAVLVDRRLRGDFTKNLEASGLYDKAYEDEWTQIYVPRPTT